MDDLIETMEEAEGAKERPSSPVTVTVSSEDSFGALLLGVIAILLLIALLRSQQEIRRLSGAAG